MRSASTTSLIALSAILLMGCDKGDSNSGSASTGAESTQSAAAPQQEAAPAPVEEAAPAEAEAPTPTATEQAAADAAESVNTAVTAAQTTVMESYLSAYEGVVDKAKDVTSQMSAATEAPQIQGLIDQLNGYAAQLEEYSPETMAKLREIYDTQLADLKSRFDAELTRLQQSDEFKPIADLLAQIKQP